MEGLFKLLAEKEAFHSCQIEGIFPKSWTFTDYLLHKSKEEQKEKRRINKLKKKEEKEENVKSIDL